jgi:translocation and assembly module TamB
VDLVRFTMTQFRPQRLKQLGKWLRPIAKTVGVSLLFLGSAVGGVLLHLNTKEARGVARSVTNVILKPVFRGRIVVGRIDALSLTGAKIAEATILDPNGEEVIYAEGIDAKILTPKLLKALWDGTAIPIDIPHARIERARVTLIPDEELIPSIAYAFYPRDDGPPSIIPGPDVVVSLPHIEIGEASVTGSVGVPIEGQVARVNASMLIDTADTLSLDVDETGLRLTDLLPAVTTGTASYHLRVRLAAPPKDAPHTEPLEMWGDFGGQMGDVPLSGNMRMVGMTLTSTVQLPRVDPGPLKGVLPWFPLETRVTASLSANGTLPRLGLRGTAELTQGTGISTAIVSGAMDVARGMRMDLDINAASLDPKSLFKEAPEGRVDGRARIRIGIEPESLEPNVSIEVATFAAEAFGQPIPSIDGVFDLIAGSLLGSVTVHEQGMPIDGRFSLVDGRVAFSAITHAEALRESSRLGGLVDGNVKARVDGSFDKGELQAKISASGYGIGAGKPRVLEARSATVEAELSGPIDKLELTSNIQLSGAVVSGEKLDNVRVTGKGPLLSPQVTLAVIDENRGKISARAQVGLIEKKASGVSFEIDRQGERAKGTLASIGLTTGGLSVEGLRVEEGSVGAMRGSLRFDRDELAGDLHGENVDLARLSRLLALPGGLAGLANVDVRVRKTALGRTGTVEVELEQGTLFQVSGVSARLSAKLDEDKVEASGYVRLVDEAQEAERIAARAAGDSASLCDGPIAEVRFANAKGAIHGPILALDTWRKATGSVDVFAENWNLRCVEKRIPVADRPFDHMAGLASMRFSLAREAGDKHASVRELSLGTKGLEIVGKRSIDETAVAAGKPKEAPLPVPGSDELDPIELGEPSWESKLLDLTATGSFDGNSGATELSVSIFDDSLLARIKSKATFDIDALFAGGDARTKSLRSAPFEIALDMPRRTITSLSSLPKPLATWLPELDGEVGANAQLGGSFNAPTAYVAVQALGVLPSAIGRQRDQWLPALNMDFTANYEPSTGRSLGGLSLSLDRAPVAIISGSVDLPVEAITDPKPDAPLPWKADLNAELYELPLHAVPALSDREVSGLLSGNIALKGLNDKPSASIDLVLSTLRIHDVFLQGLVKGQIQPPKQGDDGLPHALGSVSVAFKEPDGGTLNVTGNLGVLWKDLVYPAPDPGSEGELVVQAKRFGIAPAFPIVAGVLTKLDGVLDGSVKILWGKLGQADKGRIAEADLTLTDAVAYIPQFGQELHDGKATIKSDPARADGLQEIHITNVEAQGISGRVHGTAVAVMDGLALASARAELVIDEDEELPLTIEGVPLGKVRGDVKMNATPREDGIDIDATIADAWFELPTASTRDVISLDDAPGVRVTPMLSPPEEKRDEKAWRYRFNVTIEDAEITSDALKLKLATVPNAPLALELSDRFHTTGDVVLREGSIVLNKKTFEIDEGLVRLRDEDTGNPYVNLTAHWEATSGSRVFVDYIGLLKPITDDKIHFRSDPPLSQQEIVALLVFGDSSANATNLAGTVGSTFASGFANDLLGTAFGGVLRDVLALNVSATESGGQLGAQVKLSDKFRFGGSVEQVQETDADSTTVQRTGNCGDLYFDYKISSNWSLRGSGGYCGYQDQTGGTDTNRDGVTLGLDVLWQFRY